MGVNPHFRADGSYEREHPCLAPRIGHARLFVLELKLVEKGLTLKEKAVKLSLQHQSILVPLKSMRNADMFFPTSGFHLEVTATHSRCNGKIAQPNSSYRTVNMVISAFFSCLICCLIFFVFSFTLFVALVVFWGCIGTCQCVLACIASYDFCLSH